MAAFEIRYWSKVCFASQKHLGLLDREKEFLASLGQESERHQFDEADCDMMLSGKVDERTEFLFIQPTQENAI
jgi:hypothetical protein